jgi:pheromone shutdown-related protein TraB
MLKAAELSDEIGAQLVLADREVRITMKRVWRSLSCWDRSKLLGAIVQALFSKQTVSKEEIERLKDSDILEQALAEFSKLFPNIKRPLISERDLYLCEKIRSAPGKRIVAVVGAGHCPGIKRSWEEAIDLNELNQIPAEPLLNRVVTWGVPILLLVLLFYFGAPADLELGWGTLWLWFLVSGTLVAVGSLICLTHPLTAIIAVVTAPVAALIPVLRPGLVAGLVQARLLKPRVADLEGLMKDITSLKGCYTNRVVHTLLTVLLINALAKLALILFPILLLMTVR